jgi:hypothetical protein
MALPGSPAIKQRTRARPRATTTPAWRSFPGTAYRPRRPTQTPLYQVVQHHLETFLARSSESDPTGYGLPEWVERDFRGYLECGILAHGFARARCEDRGHERLIPFSCKGRGICPSCNARRMCEVAAQLGAVSFFHRFGSSLNVHPHHAFIATATTVSWLQMPGCGLTSWPSVGPRRLRPKGTPLHRPFPPSRRPSALPLPESAGPSCSRASMTYCRSCVPPAAPR